MKKISEINISVVNKVNFHELSNIYNVSIVVLLIAVGVD